MNETIRPALKMLTRLLSWFFIFEVLLLMLGIVLVLNGFPETRRFINFPTMIIIPGTLSCYLTFHFTRKELENERKK